MGNVLFSSRSIWTMVHGIVLGGGALLGLSAALFLLATMPSAPATDATTTRQAHALGLLAVAIAVLLWLTVLVGTYIDFPPYRAAPLAGSTDLSHYPEALLKSNPGTTWLHSFAMELKEHVPWTAAMLATTIAFVSVRYRSRLPTDSALRRITVVLVAVCFVLVAVVSLLGMFVNKVAPLQ